MAGGVMHSNQAALGIGGFDPNRTADRFGIGLSWRVAQFDAELLPSLHDDELAVKVLIGTIDFEDLQRRLAHVAQSEGAFRYLAYLDEAKGDSRRFHCDTAYNGPNNGH